MSETYWNFWSRFAGAVLLVFLSSSQDCPDKEFSPAQDIVIESNWNISFETLMVDRTSHIVRLEDEQDQRWNAYMAPVVNLGLEGESSGKMGIRAGKYELQTPNWGSRGFQQSWTRKSADYTLATMSLVFAGIPKDYVSVIPGAGVRTYESAEAAAEGDESRLVKVADKVVGKGYYAGLAVDFSYPEMVKLFKGEVQQIKGKIRPFVIGGNHSYSFISTTVAYARRMPPDFTHMNPITVAEELKERWGGFDDQTQRQFDELKKFDQVLGFYTRYGRNYMNEDVVITAVPADKKKPYHTLHFEFSYDRAPEMVPADKRVDQQ